MRLPNSSLRQGAFLLVFILVFPPVRAAAQTSIIPARITQAVDEKNLVALRGNVHPLARPEFDQGVVADAQRLKRILLLLQRSPDQETALRQLLDEQQSKLSTNYHAWLTPEQFGRQFGPADVDIQAVKQWLTSQGFIDIKIGPGRTVVEFSGNVAQVRNAFHTEIHQFVVNGEAHMANVSDPQIPVALASVVAGIVSLHSFRPFPHVRPVGSFQRSTATGEVKPLFTPPSSTRFFPLAPGDFAKIYNVAPLLSASPAIDGTGQTIAIVGETNIHVQDVVDFRKLFGLPQNFTSKNVILSGTDPGINITETESDLDIQWSGAVAPGATIDFVASAPTETTSGVHLSAVYVVDNNLAAVMSESFGACEQNLGTVGNQFYNSLWEQASAQGITVILSSGDGGSAGCDNFNTQQTATKGLAVSGLASTPFNVAVGGTDFDQINKWSQYWNTTNDPVTQASAKGYIPEIPWNDSCAQLGVTGCGPSATTGSLNITAGSGGPSTIYSKPTWQMGVPGMPNDNHRDLPDVSLFASNGFTGSLYIICQADVVNPPNPTCNLNNFGFTFQGVGGTSASAPAFAGVMALVNQKQATPANPAPRQGNANYVLYALAKKQAAANLNCNSSAGPVSGCTFNDVTQGNSFFPNSSVGNNAVPCAGGSPNCSSLVAGVNGVLVDPASPNNPAWMTKTGYDMAAGLGSVNAFNLVNNWSSVNTTGSTASLALTPTTNVTHGQTSVAVAISVAPGTGTATPTGDVSLIGTYGPGNTVGLTSFTLDSTGKVNSTTTSLPGGTYTVKAHYAGDGTFAPSDSSETRVTVTPEASKTLISIPVFDPITGRETGNTPTSVIYGSPYIGRIDVGNAQAALTFPPQAVCIPPSCPSGTITWTDSLNGGPATPLDAGTLPLNSSGFADDFPIQLPGGSHVLSASYSGDNSFNASSSTYSLTVTPAATRILPSNPPLRPVVATPFNLAVILTMNFFGVMPSCNFTFYDGTTALQGTPNCAWQANGPFLYVSLTVSRTTVGAHTYTAKFNGDANYAPSTSASITTSVFYGTTTTLSADSTNVQYGTSISLTAVVDSTILQGGPPIGQAITFSFNNIPVTDTVTYTPFTDPSGNIALRASLATVPQSSGFYTANFAGDANYFQSGALLNVRVNIPDFSLASNLATSSITAGNSATATITVTPASNSSSPVTLTCPANGMPMGISCSFSPGTVNLSNSAAATSTLTISTLAPSSSNTTSFTLPQPPPLYLPPRLTWSLLAASILIVLFLFLVPVGSRRYRIVTASALACGLCLLLGFFGCGGGSSGGGGGGGPAPSSITLTTSSVKVPHSPIGGGSVNLTANVSSSKTPGGTVTFSVNGSNGFSASSPVLGGVAQLQLTALSVGIHTLTAQYSGDVNTLGSQTKGSLNVVVTGQTGIGIRANTGGLSHLSGVSFSLQ